MYAYPKSSGFVLWWYVDSRRIHAELTDLGVNNDRDMPATCLMQADKNGLCFFLATRPSILVPVLNVNKSQTWREALAVNVGVASYAFTHNKCETTKKSCTTPILKTTLPQIIQMAALTVLLINLLLLVA